MARLVHKYCQKCEERTPYLYEIAGIVHIYGSCPKCRTDWGKPNGNLD